MNDELRQRIAAALQVLNEELAEVPFGCLEVHLGIGESRVVLTLKDYFYGRKP